MMLGVSVWRSLVQRCVVRGLHTGSACRAAEGGEAMGSPTFDPSVLQMLVCPLSRKALRYEKSTNELINYELGIAYPIVDGIPNMIPQDARMIHREQKSKDPDHPPQ
ncbi:hypothetical protein GDO78_015463 [Eleutherodactylus coqui]|uniref:Protein preY, mitochondrial n=1 Tax=Eleutherodactylus coqui TaxID=57060 RepID=A0A8J6JP32_ELECQ|nr:hypothetical protein GDO78_015463 [Eleutherodactylus coqui]